MALSKCPLKQDLILAWTIYKNKGKHNMPKAFEGEPHNFFIPLLGSLVAFGPMSIDMYLPALPSIA